MKRIWGRVVDELHILDEAQAADAQASFKRELHSGLMLSMLRRFLKRQDA
jgi:hypothetical protein